MPEKSSATKVLPKTHLKYSPTHSSVTRMLWNEHLTKKSMLVKFTLEFQNFWLLSNGILLLIQMTGANFQVCH